MPDFRRVEDAADNVRSLIESGHDPMVALKTVTKDRKLSNHELREIIILLDLPTPIGPISA